MESNAIKAIAIGAGILIAIGTISLVMVYYNTAKESISAVGTGNNVYEKYEKNLVDILTKTNIYGTDLTNLYNYFENDVSVKFEIYKKDGILVSDNNKFVREQAKPNQKFTLNDVNNNATYFIINAID